MMLTFIRLLLIKILNFGKYSLELCSMVNQKFIEKENKNSIEKLLSFSKEGLSHDLQTIDQIDKILWKTVGLSARSVFNVLVVMQLIYVNSPSHCCFIILILQ